ncbi:MAG: methylated-DNA--[protein]-cysteine S-methyltransferase [Dehalococcoidia bacterium]|nr:methylated-DNA--[protein]-cysteine S-methyltransferase [Dehalococcoidia bacterium]
MVSSEGGANYLTQQDKILTHAIFITDWGWAGVIKSDFGLRRIVLPLDSRDKVHRIIKSYSNQTKPDISNAVVLSQKINSYLRGLRVDFNDRLDLSNSTQFQQEVWRTTCSIPYGETRSYSWVACQIGKPQAARAVGQALAHNRLPIVIPCHRVVSNDNGLGGFSAGLNMKLRLLQLENGIYNKKTHEHILD